MVISGALSAATHIGRASLLRFNAIISLFKFSARAKLGAGHAVGVTGEAIVVHSEESIRTGGAIFDGDAFIIYLCSKVEPSLAAKACVDVGAAAAVVIARQTQSALQVPTIFTDCAGLRVGAGDAVGGAAPTGLRGGIDPEIACC